MLKFAVCRLLNLMYLCFDVSVWYYLDNTVKIDVDFMTYFGVVEKNTIL